MKSRIFNNKPNVSSFKNYVFSPIPHWGVRQFFALAVVMALGSGAFAQAVNDYQTYQDGNWNDVNTWARYDGSNWVNPAPSTPAATTALVVTILNGHDVVVTANVSTDQTTINTGGSLTINSGITLTLAAGTGTDLIVNGTITNAGTINYTSGTMAVGAGGVFNHNVNSVTLPATTTTWDPTATININGITTNGTLTNMSGEVFGSFVYNSIATVAVNASFTVAGNLNFSAGTFNLGTTTTAYTITLGGALTFNGGNFSGSTSATPTTQVISFTTTGLNNGGITFSSGTMSNINLTVQSGRTVELLSALTINNNGASVRTFTVANGGILNLGSNIISGTGTFTLASGGTIHIGSQEGIVLVAGGAFGNVRTSTRTYNAGGHYVYTGTNGQATGTGLAVNNTGSITVNLANASDQITFTNTASIVGANGTLRMVRGQLANAITYNATGRLEYASTTGAQTTASNEFPTPTGGPGTLIINNADGVTLHASRTVTALTLTNGILNTSATEIITVNSNTPANISGGSSTNYVNGPLQRSFTSSLSSLTFPFPVGKSGYNPMDVTLTAATGAAMVLQGEVFDATPPNPAAAGANMGTLGSKYWQFTKVSGTGNITGATITLTQTGIADNSRIGFAAAANGTYNNIGGSGPAATITSNTFTTGGFFTIGDAANLNTTYSVGPTGDYLNLTAVAAALNTGYVTGNVIFEMQATYDGTTGETFPIVFRQFVTDGGTYTATIRPVSGAPMLTTSGDPNSTNTLIDFDGADRIIFDGRAGGTGSTIGWTFRNTRTAATVGPTFRYINDASNNTLTYIQVEGQNITTTSGTIVFSTTTATTGNDDNTISYCKIGDNGVGTPAIGIYSLGTVAKFNSGISILNNEIYNFYGATGGSSTQSGIFVSSNNTDWTITGNSFYQTASRANGTLTASHYPININNTGVNFVVSNNYIGGSQANAGGSKYTFTGTSSGTFTGIYFNPNISATGCSVENNVITNISFSRGASASAVSFIGIRNANGNTLIKNNTIGSISATNTIDLTESWVTAVSTSNGMVVDAGTTTIESNKIGGITILGATTTVGHNFYGILLGGGTSTVFSNTIGSTTVANSINASTASTHASGQFVVGIQANSATTTSIYTNNIYNLTNASVSSASTLVGIATNAATTFSVYSNNISTLTGSTTLSGILQNGTGASLSASLYLNTISGLSSGAASAAVTGIRINQGGTNNVYQNKLYDLSATGATPLVTGVATGNSSTTVTSNVNLSNNIIGDLRAPNANSASDVIRGVSIGVYSFTGRINMYYNTVYIDATSAGTNFSTSGVFHTYNSTAARGALESRNNIIINKSTPAGTGNTVAFRQSDPLAINANFVSTSNNNVYYAGTPASNRLIYIGNTSNPAQTLATYKATTNLSPRDQASFTENVPFLSLVGTSNDFLHINPTVPTQVESGAVAITSYIDDFDATGTRPATGYPLSGQLNDGGDAPDIGADEGDFTKADLTPPTFGTITVANACNTATSLAISAAITDPASGVETDAGIKPRIYFKKTSDSDNDFTDNNPGTGWKWDEATNSTSPFSFSLDLNRLGAALIPGETIQYFVVAQDEAGTPNVGISHGSFDAPQASVALAADAFPIGGTPATFVVLPCSGTVTVGSGSSDNYGAFTTATGLFQAINTASAASLIDGNLIVNVTSSISIEDGTHGLNQFAAPHTLLIQSSDAVQKVISGDNLSASTGLFRMNGADRVTFNGGTGTERRLLFRNTGTALADAVFAFSNDATNNTINNCTIEGSPASATSGVIFFGSAATGGSGNDNNTISSCDIKQAGANLPYQAVYAAGSIATNDNNVISGCNISNFFNTSTGTTAYAGVHIGTFNSAWTISNNKFFQSATRTVTGSVAPLSAIRVDYTSGVGFDIDGNIIGANDESGTGTMTYTSTTAPLMAVIYVNVGTSTPSQIRNNVISKLAFTTISTGTSAYGVFTGIYQAAGSSTISGNTFGAAGAGNAVSVTINGAGSPIVNAIKNDGTGTVLINGNNQVVNFTATAAGTNAGVNLYGVHFTAGTVMVSGNKFGTTAMTTTHTGTSNGAVLAGIYSTASIGTTITNNEIYNLNITSSTTSTASRVVGIVAAGSSQHTITGNIVHDLTTAIPNTGTGASASAIGISQVSTNTSGHTVSQNIIYALTNTSTVNATTTGIYYSGGTSGTHTISKNLIYNLRSGTGTASVINGIHVNAGVVTVSNNMIRLGYDAIGAPITNTSIIRGIYKENNSANLIYYNSVYIGGTGVGATTTSPTYAFHRNATAGADNIRNNIFWNARSNNTTTGSKHYAVSLNGSASIAAQDNNVIYASGTNGGTFGFDGTSDHASLTIWKNNTPFDDNSASGDPQFINATAVTPNLNLSTTLPTPAESGAVAISGLTDDRLELDVRKDYPNPPSGTTNGGGTSPDIGADEGDFIPADVTPPAFTYTNIPTQAICSVISTTVSVTVTDAQSGISLTANKPRMYFRQSTPSLAWSSTQFVEGTNPTGNANTSVWTFTLTYSDFSITPTAGNAFEYYFVAQDLNSTPNVGYSQSNGTVPVHSPDVAGSTTLTFPTGYTFPASGTYSFSSLTPIPAIVTVGPTGSGATYTSFTNAGGLFADILAKGLHQNVLVLVRDNITNETGANALYQWTDHCGTGYTLTIRPETASLKTVSGSLFGFALFQIEGADRVTIDGRYNGTGTNRYLKFENTYSSTSGSENNTFKFINTATNDTIRYCEIVGQTTKAAGGVVYIASGSEDISLENNLIRGGTNWATNIILADGSNNISILNNEIYNFRNSSSAVTAYGIRIQSGNGSNWTISGNSVYNTIVTSTNPQIAISFLPGASSTGNLISGNYIGGSSAQCGSANGSGYWGNSWDDGFTTNELIGISITAGDVEIANNVIQNIRMLNEHYGGIIGVKVILGTVDADIHDNIFGSLTSEGNGIICYGGDNLYFEPGNGYVYGIASAASGTLTVDNNQFSYISGGNAGYNDGNFIADGNFMRLIAHTGTGKAFITNNEIVNCFSFGIQQTGVSDAFMSYGIYLAPSGGAQTDYLIEGNNIRGPIINLGDWTNLGVDGIATSGIYVNGAGIGGTISKNIVAELYNFQTNGIIRGVYLAGTGNWLVKNNQISLNNNWTVTGSPQPDNNAVSIYGIHEILSASSTSQYFYNSVYVGGAATLPTRPLRQIGSTSAAFRRTTGGTGTNAGSVVTLKNNILINKRQGSSGSGTTHYTLINNGSSAATNWASGASDYNLLVNSNPVANCFMGYWNSSSRATHTDWRNAQSTNYSDANSISAIYTSGASNFPGTLPNPWPGSATINTENLFADVQTGDLHIKTLDGTSFKFVSDVGTPITSPAINDDFDNDPRCPNGGCPGSASAPDMGADEFVAANYDAGVVNVQSICPGSYPVQVTIKNYGLITLNTVTVNWSVNSVSQTPANFTSLGLVTGDSAVVTLGNYTFTGGNSYNIIASTSLPNGFTDEYTPNDSYTETGLQTGLSGVYTVGSGGDFTTLTAAVNYYNTYGVCGPTVFNLINSTYTTPAETFPITANATVGASAVNTLTIKPATTATISASNGTAIFKLNGADYIIIDGSNSGATDRSLTITNTSATSDEAVIWLSSASASNGATNNTIKNCNISGGSTTGTGYGIFGGGTTINTDALASNTNISVENNSVKKLLWGVWLRGNGTSPDAGYLVSGNSMGSTSVAADKLGIAGIAVFNATNPTISSNTITGVVQSIYTNTNSGILIGLAIAGGNINNNIISDIKHANSSGYGSNGIWLNSTSIASNVSVYNNIIYDVASYGYNGVTNQDNGYGIIIDNGGGYNIYYNSVSMGTNQNTANGITAAINIVSTTTGLLNIRNNIFSNTQTTGTRYAIYSGEANTAYTDINYNDYYNAGTNLGYLGGTRSNLAAWQGATTKDANSKSVNPLFTSSTDLHLQAGSTLHGQGEHIPAITTDYDGDSRSNPSTIGADEACSSPAITTHPTDATVCENASTTFSVVATGSGLTYQWRKGGTNISGATSDSYTINPVATGDAGSYDVVVTGACGSPVTSNAATLTVNTAPAVTDNPDDVTIAAGNNTSFSVTATGTNITYQWQVDNDGAGPNPFTNITNGGVYSNATTATLNITGATVGMNGYLYQCVVTGTCSPAATSNFATLTVTSCIAGTWTAGATLVADKTDWFNANNWSCGTIPNSTIDVVIPTNPTGGNYFPVVTHATLDAATKNLTIESGASVTISYTVTAGVPEGELQVNGVLTNNSSTTNFGSGFLTMKAGSSIAGNVLVDYLKIDGNTSLAASSNVGVKKELALLSGTFNVSNGTLTIESDINGTGYINDFDFPTAGPYGAITGNVTLERYIPSTGGSNIFHYIGGVTSATAGSKWSDDFGMGVTGTTGFITPGNCDPANPTTAQGSNYGGFFTYHESNVTSCYLSGWKVENSAYNITPGKGIAARIANGAIIEETGSYHASNITISNLTKASKLNNTVNYSRGYNLVANPYYAPIDWNEVAADNTSTWDGAAYVYDPGSGTYSAYNFLTTVLTLNTNQAFFVRAAETPLNENTTLSSLSFTFNANTRTKGTNTTFYRQQQGYAYGLNINVQSANGKNDNTLLAFDSLFTDVFDNGFDAMKLYNDVGVPSVYTKSGSDMQAIQALPLISASTRSVPLSILITTNGTHTFTFNGIENFPQTTIVWLEDLKTGTIQYLRQNNVYAFTANVGDDKDRFVIHFTPELLISTTASDCSGNNATITLDQRGGIEWAFSLQNANSAVITRDVFSATEVINQLAPGTYTLNLTHPASGYATTTTISVTGLQPVSAAITATTTEVLENETIIVDAQTTGATTNTWQMGDGTVYTDMQSVSHAYATEGAYEIIFTATNDGCSAVSTIKVSVNKQDTVSTGIGTVESGSIRIFENGDVLFISQSVTKNDADARVTVYNALGQIIAQADVKQLVYKAVYQMPVNAAAGIYYVHVELADGKNALRKVLLGEEK